MSKKQQAESASPAVVLARQGKLTPEASEPLWREACKGLKKGERLPFRQVTFTLHDSQWNAVQTAIKAALKAGVRSKVNANRNGNAIATICRDWLRQAPRRRPRRAS